MKLTTNTYRIALLSLVLGMSACSNTVRTPIVEDRNATSPPPRVQQTKPIENDRATTIPLPDELDSPSQPQSQYPTTTEPFMAEPNASSLPTSPSATKPAQQNSAVTALLAEANSYSKQGDYRSAQTSLQRAQRIAPREPEVYYALANTHLTLEDYSLAEQVALKGVSIVQGQPDQLHLFWNLIAVIRMEAGDSSGAKQARDTANRY